MLFTQTELNAFERKFYAGDYSPMRYGQALFHHFPQLKDEDFGDFSMFYEESIQKCAEMAWGSISQIRVVDMKQFCEDPDHAQYDQTPTRFCEICHISRK